MQAYSSYLVLDPETITRKANDAAASILRLKKRLHFSHLVVSGYSGSLFGGIVSSLTHIPLVVVRKEAAGGSHHGSQVEATPNDLIKSYLILDDFIASGDTVRRIYLTIVDYCARLDFKAPKIKGVFLYNSEKFLTKTVVLYYDEDRNPVTCMCYS